MADAHSEDLEHKTTGHESEGFIAKAGKLLYHTGVAAATTAFAYYTVGASGPIISAAVAAGNFLGKMFQGEATAYDTVISSLTAYSAINMVLYPVIGFGNVTIPFIDNYDLYGKALRTLYAATVQNFVFTTLDKAAMHLIGNYFDPTGISTAVTQNFGTSWLRNAIGFAPGWALSSNGINTIPLGSYQAPTFAVNALPHVMVNEMYPPKPLEKKEALQPAMAGAH